MANGLGKLKKLIFRIANTLILYHLHTLLANPIPVNGLLSASKLKINHQTHEGTARNVVLKVKDIPIFYWPYLSFPLAMNEKQAFCFPLLVLLVNPVANFAWPLYLNLAPNL